jgi:hypothetical protein
MTKRLTMFLLALVVPILLSGAPAQADFGFLPGAAGFESAATNPDGSPATQAGSHPYQVTTSFQLNQRTDPITGRTIVEGGELKRVSVAAPPGLIGDPNAVPQCPLAEFFTESNSFLHGECPDNTAIGFMELHLAGFAHVFTVPVYNLVPPAGTPARFGASLFSTPIILDASVRTGGDYGITITSEDIAQGVSVVGTSVTLWGVPADPSHNTQRGSCLETGLSCPTNVPPTPFLTLPTSCGVPQTWTISAESWDHPGQSVSDSSTSHDGDGRSVDLDGCNRLDFSPSLSVAPDGSAGSTTTGLTVAIHVPQEQLLVPTGLAESDLRKTVVALPTGVQLSPSAADGLLACSTAEIALESASEPTCPNAAKVATVEIATPLLPNALVGEVYLAAQDENPFGSLLALYLVAKDPVSGVLIKLAGQVIPDPVTGQLTATFDNTPQLPFSDLRLSFFGTARAPLTTPPLCGTYTTTTAMYPWSGSPPSTPSSSFAITSGPGGSACQNPQPFAPGFEAGTTNIEAGAFSPFTLTMTRPDADQQLGAVSMRMPPGLLGMLSSVKLCGEPQAALGMCGPESLIGHTIVSAGLGNDPFTVTGGQVFITGPYKGAPYGLSIVNPAQAGPFDLGTVVVRARIEVDPHTADLTIVSDPLPTILQGIPLQLQHVNVTVDRPGFTFNPTNCDPLSIDGALTSSQGQSAAVSTPFQVTNCARLEFEPGFSVSTSGHPSRANGASLAVKLVYPKAPVGSQANIAQVKVELPKQLPSRLTTLQKACPDSTFDADPSNCPAASRVGHAVAVTPVLSNPLQGEAYFVSHGGAAFPDLIVVLQAEGLTVDLVGTTFISKAGITSSTFKSVPDVPIGSFALTLPQGPYSALAANGNLCKSKLRMPTTFTGQNGAVIHQVTKINVTGCKQARRTKSHAQRVASRPRKTRKA